MEKQCVAMPTLAFGCTVFSRSHRLYIELQIMSILMHMQQCCIPNIWVASSGRFLVIRTLFGTLTPPVYQYVKELFCLFESPL